MLREVKLIELHRTPRRAHKVMREKRRKEYRYVNSEMIDLYT